MASKRRNRRESPLTALVIPPRKINPAPSNGQSLAARLINSVVSDCECLFDGCLITVSRFGGKVMLTVHDAFHEQTATIVLKSDQSMLEELNRALPGGMLKEQSRDF